MSQSDGRPSRRDLQHINSPVLNFLTVAICGLVLWHPRSGYFLPRVHRVLGTNGHHRLEQSATMTETLQLSDESRVLVIFTGGTIGMLGSKNGLSNEPNVLLDTLRSQSRFHDPHEDSLYSHSSSVEGYRSWSGRSSPIVEHFKSSATGNQLPSLPVRSSRPLRSAALSPGDQSPVHFNTGCTKLADGTYEGYIPSLITPRMSSHDGQSKRIRYAILEVRDCNEFRLKVVSQLCFSGILCLIVAMLKLTVNSLLMMSTQNNPSNTHRLGPDRNRNRA